MRSKLLLPLVLLLIPAAAHGQTSASAPGVAANGQIAASIPIAVPGARGGAPVAVPIRYSGSQRLQELGVGWNLDYSFVYRTRTLSHTRPKFHAAELPPEPIDRVHLNLGGRSMLMVEESPGLYRPMTNAPTVTMLEQPDGWLVHDGHGYEYRFVADSRLADDSTWLLTEINDRTGNNPIRFIYDIFSVELADGSANEIDLRAIEYNQHPSGGCAKHRVDLIWATPALLYDEPPMSPGSIAAAAPLTALSAEAFAGTLRARARVLQRIDVLAHGDSCAEPADRRVIRAYHFAYERDADTGLPRLTSSDVEGDDGSRMPLARYEYGAVASAGLDYEVSQTLPAGFLAPGRGLGWTGRQGNHRALTSSFVDLTGDGRADYVYEESGSLVLVPSLNAASSARSGPTAALGQLTLPAGLSTALSVQDDASPSPSPDGRFESVYVQLVDFNGDRRPDILHADRTDSWTLYVNLPASAVTPGASPHEIVWDERRIPTSAWRDQLIDIGLLPSGYDDIVPLSRAITVYRFSNVGVIPNWSSPRTFREWTITDFNGDGYPDLVTNDLPAGVVETSGCALNDPDDCAVIQEPGFVSGFGSKVAAGRDNRFLVHLNKAGNYLFDDVWPFASPVVVDDTNNCAVELWRGGGIGSLQCGLRDLSGDGIVDLVTDLDGFGPALRLGTGTSFHGPTSLPGMPSTFGDVRACLVPEYQNVEFELRTRSGYFDFNADGIPDYFRENNGSRYVQIGTGLAYGAPIPGAPNPYVAQVRCSDHSVEISQTMHDLDGDGRLDLLRLTDDGIEVARLRNSWGIGAYNAGRLRKVRNGYGAHVEIYYVSAKNDPHGDHYAPFAEIVADTTVLRSPKSGVQVPEQHAYGGSTLRFDAARDRWGPTAFARRVTMRADWSNNVPQGDGIAPGYGSGYLGQATVLDSIVTGNDATSYAPYALHGRPRTSYQLDGVMPEDAWPLLAFEDDPDLEAQLHGSTSITWKARQRSAGALDCLSYPGHARASSLAGPIAIGGRYDRPCSSVSYAYPAQTDRWEGAASFGGRATFTRSLITDVDSFGRPRSIVHQNDLKDDNAGPAARAAPMENLLHDDNVCVDIEYASVAAFYYSAVSSRFTHQCKPSVISDHTAGLELSEVEYDGLGRPVHATRTRYETTSGLPLASTTVSFEYDHIGNLVTTRESDGSREQWSHLDELDPFRMTAARVTHGSNDPQTPARSSTIEIDPFSGRLRSSQSADGAIQTYDYDGFGRDLSSGLILPEIGVELLVSETRWVGFETGSTGDRYVESTAYLTEDGTESLTARTYIDDLGRPVRTEQPLGGSYDLTIVRDEVSYDRWGRTEFVADPYVKGAGGARYGTTYHYRPDGTLACEIRADGVAPLVTKTDDAVAIYPTCYVRQYDGENVVMRMYGPEDLVGGLDFDAPHWREVLTSGGRVLERARVGAGGGVLDRARFSYDKLGNLQVTERYADAAAATGPVTWAFARDTDGRALTMSEPGAPPVFNDYDPFGLLRSTEWDDNSGSRAIRYQYDGLGRLREQIEERNGVEIPESRVAYQYDAASSDPRFGYRTGRLSSAVSFGADGQPTMTVDYGYDALGRMRAVTRTSGDGTVFHEDYRLRLDGQLSGLTYRLPDNGHAAEMASYQYDSAGRLERVRFTSEPGPDLYQAAYDPFGRATEVRYGNGVIERFNYRPNRRRELLSTYLESPSGEQRATTYAAYTPDLRVKERIDSEIGTSGQLRMESTVFSYDQRHQVTSAVTTDLATSSGAARAQSYSYDSLGNLRSVDDLGDRDVSLTYRQDDPDRVCRTEPAPPPEPQPIQPVQPVLPIIPGIVVGTGPTRLWYEAEDGELTGTMIARSISARSRGGQVETPEDASSPYGMTEIEIEVPKTGTYYVWVRLLAPDTGSNQISVHPEGNPYYRWTMPAVNGWRWRAVGPSGSKRAFHLTKGKRFLRLQTREDGIAIDRVFLTTSYSDSPGSLDVVAPVTTRHVEAEESDIVFPFVLDLADEASRGELVATPPGLPAATHYGAAHGKLEAEIEVPVRGHYALWLRIHSQTSGADELYLTIDDRDPIRWDTVASGDLRLQKAREAGSPTALIVFLEAGAHRIELATKETGWKVDQIILTNHLTAAPGTPVEGPVDDCQYRYDERGNVVTTSSSSGPSRHFVYDGLSRIKHITTADRVASYQYGPDGAILSLDVTSPDLLNNRYDLHAGPFTRAHYKTDVSSEVLYERALPGIPVARRGFGPEAAMVYAHGDEQGTRRITDRGGSITQELAYTPFGALIDDAGDPARIDGTHAGFNYGDHLRDFDVVQVGARIYDPRTGRFLQRDPLMITRTASMMNPYAFAWNDPVNLSDPTGMDPNLDRWGCIPEIGCIDPDDFIEGALAGAGSEEFNRFAPFAAAFLMGHPEIVRDLYLVTGVTPGQLQEIAQIGAQLRAHQAEVNALAVQTYNEIANQAVKDPSLIGTGIIVDSFKESLIDAKDNFVTLFSSDSDYQDRLDAKAKLELEFMLAAAPVGKMLKAAKYAGKAGLKAVRKVAPRLRQIAKRMAELKNTLRRMMKRSDRVNLASPQRTKHILYGDATGGGHKFGLSRLFNGKSKFPKTWSDSRIMHAVSEVATSPNSTWVQQTGRAGASVTRRGVPVKFKVEGVYEGVRIRVIVQGNNIITAFPIK